MKRLSNSTHIYANITQSKKFAFFAVNFSTTEHEVHGGGKNNKFPCKQTIFSAMFTHKQRQQQ